uniref:Response regulator transcription factor n=1 Tax=Eiseniibacteriota bacterium TaxID=2212470 RepID=A0A832MKP9_UNCEI
MTAAARRTRVLLADDHALVRAGLRRILDAQPGLQVVGEVEDGAAALAALRREEVDVLVLDLTMPGKDGFAVLAEAKRLREGLKILVLTMHADPEYVARAVREGADGYLLKDSAVNDLVAGIESVREGRAYFTPRIQQELTEILRAKPAPPSPLELLTEREREVLTCIAEGLSTKEIAARFDISIRTVETHRANLMRKLDLHSVARLVQFAIREGLVKPP